MPSAASPRSTKNALRQHQKLQPGFHTVVMHSKGSSEHLIPCMPRGQRHMSESAHAACLDGLRGGQRQTINVHIVSLHGSSPGFRAAS